jgi:demethylmenaquinone methyltransferase/2-methoxy-6-polyprenyl-1,4-benzoquinol methylase
LDEKSSQIRRMFSAISRRYDLLNHLLSFDIDRSWRKTAARETGGFSPARVLDLCAGTGDLGLAILNSMGETGHVVAADFSREMLRIGMAKTEKRNLARRMSFVEADGMRLALPDNCVDASAIAFGLRNIVDWPKGLREMARATRPGGKIIVLEFSTPPSGPMRWAYLLYFAYLLPGLGNLVSRSKAYGYLRDTVLNWPSPDELAQAMREAGLADVRYRRLTFGIACLHVGVVQ